MVFQNTKISIYRRQNTSHVYMTSINNAKQLVVGQRPNTMEKQLSSLASRNNAKQLVVGQRVLVIGVHIKPGRVPGRNNAKQLVVGQSEELSDAFLSLDQLSSPLAS